MWWCKGKVCDIERACNDDIILPEASVKQSVATTTTPVIADVHCLALLGRRSKATELPYF
jgi:hypothetical protein